MTRRLPALVSLFLCLCAVAACGGDDDAGGSSGGGTRPGSIKKNEDNAKTTIRVGSKDFTEQKVLGEIFAQGLRAAGYEVETQLGFADEQVAQQALKRSEEHTSELQSRQYLVCRLLLEKKNKNM